MKLFLLPLFLLTAYQAGAQVTYVNIEPDYYQNTSGDKRFDVNADGVPDLEFSLTILNPATDVWFTLNTHDSVDVWIDSTNFNSVKRIDQGVLISAAGKWKTASNIPVAYLTSGSKEGPWPGSTDKCLAFRLKKGSNYQYGWMRLSVHEKVNNYTVKDYAYRQELNMPITAGQQYQTSVAPATLTTQNLVMELFDKKIRIHASTGNFSYSIYTLSGIEKMHGDVYEDQTNIDMAGFSAGIYIIGVHSAGSVLFKKIFIGPLE